MDSRWFDAWSLAHLAFGMWAGDRGWGLGKLLVAHTAWEFTEKYFCERYLQPVLTRHPVYNFPGIFYYEPLTDRIGDTLSASAGWALTR